MSSSDRQPLLPTHSNPKPKPHMNHSNSSKLSTTKITFPSSSTSALGSPDDDDEGTLVSTSPQTKGKNRGFSGSPLTRGENQKRPGLPKVSRECLVSEFKCYGSYMIPPLLVFGLLAIGISLLVYGKRNGWY